MNPADHDLLIELKTEMRGMRVDLKELKDNMADRVSHLEGDKVDKIELTRFQKEAEAIHVDHEKRIRRLEYSIAIATGIWLTVDVLLRFYFKV